MLRGTGQKTVSPRYGVIDGDEKKGLVLMCSRRSKCKSFLVKSLNIFYGYKHRENIL